MNVAEAARASSPARTFEVFVTRRVKAPAERVYAVFADYREAHPKILPPSFFAGLTVEEGGHGAGTIVVVTGRFAGRTRAMRGVVTEPEPGRRLVESYPEERTVTTFVVDGESGGEACRVTISTVLPTRRGPGGWIERRIVRRLLNRVYAEELELLAAYVARQPGARDHNSQDVP